MDDASKIKQKISRLNEKRWGATKALMQSEKLLTASFYERYTKCGNPSCKCASGELHGPFPWIYRNKKGSKLISTSCVADKVDDAKKYSENYKVFKENKKVIKQTEEEINKLIEKLEKLYEIDAYEFVKKKGETRGRKQKESN